MSLIQASSSIAQVKPEEVARFVDIFFQDILRVVNGDIDFFNNVNCKIMSITFLAADTDSSVAHGLGRIPTGYIQVSSNAAMSLYDGSVPRDATTLYLRSNAVGTAGILVF